ncbi:hypothetical protein DPMN_009880 [Dreissena polymorpha]|uniref:Uncharacterized protein n=1 Tax=Dreissena polymorpha TaxID=45954 RepID=A0A9D4N337_DREPO|nr:hypothetical protein DPMN_009880 [Dreissena polymorpha]
MSSQLLELHKPIRNKKNVVEANVDGNCDPPLAQLLQLAQEIQHEDVLPMKTGSQGGFITTSTWSSLKTEGEIRPFFIHDLQCGLGSRSVCDGTFRKF